MLMIQALVPFHHGSHVTAGVLRFIAAVSRDTEATWEDGSDDVHASISKPSFIFIPWMTSGVTELLNSRP